MAPPLVNKFGDEDKKREEAALAEVLKIVKAMTPGGLTQKEEFYLKHGFSHGWEKAREIPLG